MYTSLLYQELIKKHNVEFISFKKLYPSLLYPGKSDKDFKSKELLTTQAIKLLDPTSPFSWFVTYKKIKKYSPDVVIFSWWVSFFAPSYFILSTLIKSFSNVKILFLCHNVIEHETNIIKRWITKSVLQKGDCFIVHSIKDSIYLQKAIPDKKIRKVFHPLYDVYNYDNLSKEKARAILEENSDIILFFGFVREYKGLKYLIKAFSKLSPSFDLKLYIIGEFWQNKDEYIQLIKKFNLQDKIIIRDSYIANEEVQIYFSASDIVVLPYLSATGSGIVKIAYGFNKPVIVTDTGALSEVVEDCKTGFIVPPENSDAITSKLEQFYSMNDKDKFSKYIAEYKKQFSFSKITKQIEEFVEI